ncbi:MAG TPA: hypothetical protein VFO57_11360 [Burkholderiales bacterium]|nr:hypothetical protein [Burkholderiales bacterium]
MKARFGTREIIAVMALGLAVPHTALASDARTAVGGGVGGAGGAAVGQAVDKDPKRGAIVGGAVGGAAGAAATTSGKGKTGAIVGGAVGGGAGAAIGQSVGGKTGAIVGGGVGGATGAVVGSKIGGGSGSAAPAVAAVPAPIAGTPSARQYSSRDGHYYDGDPCARKGKGKGWAKGHAKKGC